MIIGIIVAVLVVAAIIALVVVNKNMEKVPGMSAKECLEYTLKDNDEGVITVGTIKNGEVSWTVYGKDGKELSKQKHIYEIGSLTKTITATLVSRAIEEGRLNIEDTVDKYIELPSENTYPTLKNLLTHTSGYKDWYMEKPMAGNFFGGRNAFFGVTKDMLISRLGKLDMKKSDYDWNYSNFGYATLGMILEKVYGEDYCSLADAFLSEIGMENAHISRKDGDLGKYWDWNLDDAYLSAGAVTADIEDMLTYAKLQLANEGYVAKTHEIQKRVDVSTAQYDLFDIKMSDMGMGWIIDEKNGFIWHNGGTDNYNSYLGVDPANNNAVVILSNLSGDYRIPATVIGIKILKDLK